MSQDEVVQEVLQKIIEGIIGKQDYIAFFPLFSVNSDLTIPN